MSIQRKITNPQLVKTKNYIRGTALKRIALEEVRASENVKSLDKISSWSYGWLSEIRQLNSLAPSTYKKIDLFNGLNPVGLKNELLWTLGALIRESSRLSRHVKIKDRFERSLIGSNLTEANDALDEHFASVGPTLFYLSNKITLVQEMHGTEAQKSFTAQFQNSDVGEFSGFMSYWWSVRSQKEITFDYFKTLFNKNLKNIGVKPEVYSYFAYQMFGEVYNKEHESAILAFSSSTTAIDLYENLIFLSTRAFSKKSETQDFYKIVIERLAGIIEDQRLYKLCLISGDASHLDKIVSPRVPILEKALTGTLSNLNIATPRTMCELHLAAPHIELIQLPNNIISSIAFNLKNITKIGEEGKNAYDGLKKLSTVLMGTALGRWCWALSDLFAPGERPFRRSLDGIRYVYSGDGLLEACAVLPENVRDSYSQYIETQYPKGPIHSVVNEIFSEKSRLKIVSSNGSRLQEFLALRQSYFCDTRELLATKVDDFLEFKKTRTATFLKCWTALERGNVGDSLAFATKAIMKNSGYSNWLPIKEIAKTIYVDFENFFPNDINASILYYMLNEQEDNYSAIISFTAEDYIDALGVFKPSEMIVDPDDEFQIFFLAKVCSFETMRRFSEFQTLSDLENERIAICGKLGELDPENRSIYEDEAQEIMTQRKINEAVQHLHASKISIDEDALNVWADLNLRDDFRRFLELKESGQIIVDEDLREALLASFETGVADRSLFEIPKNESAELLVTIAEKFITQCFVDQEHGLNCYLSIEIRHGALEGTLRSAPEKEGIITRKIKELDDYEPNKRWKEIAEDNLVPLHEWEFIEDILKVFAKKYDTLLSKLTDNCIQIRTDEKPEGLFDPRVTPIVIYSLANDVEKNPTFEQLLSSLFEIFWTMLSNNLEKVRQYIDVDIKNELDKLYEQLERDIRENRYLPTLADAIVTAKNENESLIKQVHDWFELPSKSVSHSFDIEGYLRIALETVKGFHPEFNPNVSIVDDEPTIILGGLKILPKVFFEIFQNIFGHCGSLVPEIKVNVASNDEKITIKTVNSVDKSANTELISTRIAASRQALNSSAYRAQISREGGTGFPKLARLIEFKPERENLKFDIDLEKGEFWVEMTLETRTFQGAGNDTK